MCWFAVVCCESCRLLRIFRSFYNTSHKFWDQSPSPHYQCCFQVFETVPWHKLPCCYSSNILQHWVGGRDLIYSCKLDQSRIFINFSMNWLGLINLCEILKFAVHNSRLLLGCWGKKKKLLMILGAGFHIIFQSSSDVVCTNGYDYQICNMMLLQCINFTANIYLFKVNNKNTRKRNGICSKFKWKVTVFIVDFEHILELFLVLLLLTLNKKM